MKMVSNKIIAGISNDLIWIRIWLHITSIAWKILKNPVRVIKILMRLELIRRSYMGDSRPKKLAKTGNRYFWDIGIPGWPSSAFTNLIKGEINRVYPFKEQTELTSLMLSVTNKCPLQCEHCYEWDNLNKKDELSSESLRKIVHDFQQRGIAHIMLGGGEPMMKYVELLKILNESKKCTDFWLVTSGINFTKERARRLKEEGLTGIYLSLDNFDEMKHDSFRHYNGSFQNAKMAAKNAVENGIVVGLSLCPVRSFLSKQNLDTYASLARDWAVSFILVVEPRDVGHYSGKDVLLNLEEFNLLEEFFYTMNNSSDRNTYPIVTYPAHHQQKTGCYGAASRYMFIDQMGNIQTCPFCRQKGGNILDDSLDESLENLRKIGCSKYRLTEI